jgi:hypothetical protein
MKLEIGPYEAIDWSKVPAEEYPGETGSVTWRTLQKGEVRIRMVECSPGYLSDHWCTKGHVIFVVKGEVVNELKDGRETVLRADMGYTVSDGGEAHRSRSEKGATMFIVD